MKEKAVFYARVSTEEEKQVNALTKQIQENKDIIKAKGWELVDEYVDEGKTGTKIKGRDEYQRLYEDMLEDKFDIVVIKDQDRLMRNTLDWYLFVDRLVTHNKRLYMYLENSWYTPDNSLITGIKAIMAEEYSRNLSKKINNSYQRRIERALRGEKLTTIGNGLIYGYDMVNGEYVINEDEADKVRLIFDLYLEGNGIRNIGFILYNMGYKNRAGNPIDPTTIGRILKNEKYIGTTVVNKEHYDFEKKKHVVNPESEWVRFPDTAPVIVDKEKFDKVQEIMASRRGNNRGKKTGDNPLSSKIYCGLCGEKYWKNNTNTGIRWRCSTYVKYGKATSRGATDKGNRALKRGCDGSTIGDKDIREILNSLIEKNDIDIDFLKKSALEWLESLKSRFTDNEANNTTLKQIKALETKIQRLTEAYLDGIIPKDEYKTKREEIEKGIKTLKDSSNSIEEKEIAEIQAVIDNIDEDLEEWIKDGDFEERKTEFVIEHTKRIIVSGTHLVIELDFLAGVIIAGKEFYLYVDDTRRFCH